MGYSPLGAAGGPSQHLWFRWHRAVLPRDGITDSPLQDLQLASYALKSCQQVANLLFLVHAVMFVLKLTRT
jgi:hypothetical protein